MKKRLLFEDYIGMISKEDIINEYIKKNKTYSECCEFFNIGSTTFAKLLKEYQIKKPQILHTQNIKKSKLEKYGDENYNNSNQIKSTCIIKYGVDNQFKRTDLMTQIRNENEKKYGSKNNIYKNHLTRAKNSGNVHESYLKQIEKTKATVQQKYGVDWASKSEIVKNAIRESLKETFNEKYNCDNYWCSEEAVRSNGSKNSKANLAFEKLLIDNNILYKREFLLATRWYDFKIGNTLIEINPTATHNSTWSPWNKNFGLDKNYHADKTDIATKNGYKCIHVWDWDDQNKIIQTFLLKKEAIGARVCEIKLVDKNTEIDYLNTNHLQGYTKSKVALGLYYNNELVLLMTFGKPRYSKKYEWEIIRLCGNRNVFGGAEKLFKYFIENYSPISIISYCDLSKFNGNVYKNLGFKKIGRAIGKHWYNIKMKDHITDKLLFKYGFDKLLGATFGNFGVGSDNALLMLEHGFVEIYDCGQATYVWKRETSS